MSDLTVFLNENKIKRENKKYAPTKSFLDKEKKPIEWEFKPLTSSEVDNIRADNTIEVPVIGKPGQYRQKVDNKGVICQMIVESVVYPDLYDIELQNSYGVQKPDDLLLAMIDNPGEYDNLGLFVQNMNGYISLDEKVEEAKN